MAHLNGTQLQTWKKGDQLGASDLNGNFAVLADRIERVMVEALMPDPASVGLERQLHVLGERIANLEHLTAMHARQRNEKEWAPLSHLGALVVLVNEANRRMEDATRRIDQMHAGLGLEHEDLDRRLRRIEQQPDSATEEDFTALAADHHRLALKEHMLMSQVIALRAEVSILRDLALGKDRQANRLEYAPMAYVGHILQRLQKLERPDG